MRLSSSLTAILVASPMIDSVTSGLAVALVEVTRIHTPITLSVGHTLIHYVDPGWTCLVAEPC